VTVLVDRGLKQTAVIDGCYGDVSRGVELTPNSARTCVASRSTPPPAHNPPFDVRRSPSVSIVELSGQGRRNRGSKVSD